MLPIADTLIVPALPGLKGAPSFYQNTLVVRSAYDISAHCTKGSPYHLRFLAKDTARETPAERIEFGPHVVIQFDLIDNMLDNKPASWLGVNGTSFVEHCEYIGIDPEALNRFIQAHR